MLLDDMNARTATKNDFIRYDILKSAILSDGAEIHTYEVNIVLPVRNNPDVTVNDFGLKLLNLCKSRGLRSLKGRLVSAIFIIVFQHLIFLKMWASSFLQVLLRGRTMSHFIYNSTPTT